LQSKNFLAIKKLAIEKLCLKMMSDLGQGEHVEPELKEMVTIYFSDIVGFTTLSSSMNSLKVFNMLERLYRRFDELAEKYCVFKLETIGDGEFVAF
jgi:class 3 adenylate cyclase